MFRLKESSSGQLLKHIWGTSSESAHLGSQNFGIEPCLRYIKWKCTFGIPKFWDWTIFEIHQVKVHIWDPKILGLNHVWGTSSKSAHLGSQNFGIEPCLRYIKWKCTFGILKFCDWTMFEVHQVKVHIWDPEILGLNHVWGTSSESAHLESQNFGIEPCLRYIKWKCTFGIPKFWDWNMFEVHQVKVHIWDPKILGLKHVWGTSSESAHLGSQNFGIETCLRYIKWKCTFGIPKF